MSRLARGLSAAMGIAAAAVIGATVAHCGASPLSPSEQAALDESAKACLEAAIMRRADAGVADARP